MNLVTQEFLTCPLCGLLCDDLAATPSGLDSKNCGLARQYFAAPPAVRQNWGHSFKGDFKDDFKGDFKEDALTTDQAVALAADWLRRAKMPVFLGPGADHAGLQALLRLADRVGAVVDGRSRAQKANMRAGQRWGHFNASFNEIANRADVIWLVGGDFAAWPRLAERLWQNRHSLYRAAPPRIFHWQIDGDSPINPINPVEPNATTRRLSAASLLASLSFVLAAAQGGEWRQASPLPEHLSANAIAPALQAAKYAAIIWDAASFPPDQAEMAVGLMTLLLRKLNETTHAVGLPLGGGENSTGLAHITTWQTAHPFEVSLTPDGAESDPFLYDGSRLVAAGEADLLLWLDGFGLAKSPPPVTQATKVIALCGSPPPPDLFSAAAARLCLRVGRPGIDHGGDVARADSSMSLPLRPIYGGSQHPTISDFLTQVAQVLG